MVQAWRRTVTPLLVLALLLSTPSGAAAQWNTNTVASYLALFMVLGSLFFGWAGMYDKNFFVLLGNLACTAGSVSVRADDIGRRLEDRPRAPHCFMRAAAG